jgi:hypothetical protein
MNLATGSNVFDPAHRGPHQALDELHTLRMHWTRARRYAEGEVCRNEVAAGDHLVTVPSDL